VADSDLETVIRRLGDDGEFRAAVHRDPRTALAPYRLSSAELRAVEQAAGEQRVASEGFESLFTPMNEDGD
jgi:hypothetical protein